MYTRMSLIFQLQKEREVKRQRKILEQQLGVITNSEDQSSTTLVAIDDCKYMYMYMYMYSVFLFSCCTGIVRVCAATM